MSRRTISMTDQLYTYLLEATLREPPLLAQLREETAKMPGAGMQISPEQGQFMALLVELIGAKRTLEIGTFTGYSSLWVALALPEDGQLVACDVSEQYTNVARRYWKQAGVEAKVQLKLGPAQESLAQLIHAGQQGTYDFAFIDADKSGYDTYYEQCLELLRPGGLIAVDNTLWGGAVADARETGDSTRAIRALNAKVRDDQRVSCSLLPVGDGLLLARKRAAQ